MSGNVTSNGSRGLGTSDIIGIAIGVPSALVALISAIIAFMAWKYPETAVGELGNSIGKRLTISGGEAHGGKAFGSGAQGGDAYGGPAKGAGRDVNVVGGRAYGGAAVGDGVTGGSAFGGAASA